MLLCVSTCVLLCVLLTLLSLRIHSPLCFLSPSECLVFVCIVTVPLFLLYSYHVFPDSFDIHMFYPHVLMWHVPIGSLSATPSS